MARRSIGILTLVAILGSTGLAAAADPPADDALDAVLWHQTSVEAQAVALSAFALARLRLDEALRDPHWTAAPREQGTGYEARPPAVILAVDDAALDTSAYQAWTITDRARFSAESFARFVARQSEPAIPGAVAFARDAASRGVTVFYLARRDAALKAATVATLRARGFPVAEGGDTALFERERPDWNAAQGTRRAAIARDHRILLIVGAQFGDFTDSYKGGMAGREAAFTADAPHWGHDWIMLANPTYGSFEAAPYEGATDLHPGDKRAHKIEALKPWDGK